MFYKYESTLDNDLIFWSNATADLRHNGEIGEDDLPDELLHALKETDLSVNQLKNLLKHEYPLEACYNEWIKNDLSLNEVLKSSIQNCADNKFQEEVQQENDTIEDMEM